ncbi:hypothetical protein [Streptomyces sp. NPDC002845]
MSLSATVGEPGDEIDFEGTGFEPGQEDVEASFASKVVILGWYTADASGTVAGTFSIPEQAEPGEHLFLLRAEDPDLTLSTEITVLDDGDDDGDDDHGDKPDHDNGHKPDHGDKPDHDNGHDNGGRPDHDNGHDNGGRPSHDNGHDNGGRPSHDNGHDNGGRPSHGHSDEPHLADTGEDRSAILLGGTAGLLLLGGGVILLTRRMRRG